MNNTEKTIHADPIHRQIIKSKNDRISILWNRVKELEKENDHKDKVISDLRAITGSIMLAGLIASLFITIYIIAI